MSVELRAPTLDDVDGLTELVNRDAGELYGERDETPESIALWLTGPGLDPAKDARIAVEGDVVRGWVDIYAHPDPTYWSDLRVPPSERGEVRTTLLDWVEDEARRRGAGKSGARLRLYTSSKDAPMKSALEERGYRRIRGSYRMRIDFEHEVPEPDWPDGVVVRDATHEDAELAHETQEETFQDSWEHSPYPFDEWRHWMVGYEGFDPSLWFIAESAGEVAGISLCRVSDADHQLGWVSILGVRRPWRRQGLGRALLLHTFREFRRRGIPSVGLGVDAESLTGAQKLYESAGMRVVRQNDIYEQDVS
ncbi:MAG: GNAT family N-acetyltransferase [Gaiellaceae bacterium]